MLVMSKGALSAAQAETYYEEKYSQDDYYTEKRGVVGQWFGGGATALGLAGAIASGAQHPGAARSRVPLLSRVVAGVVRRTGHGVGPDRQRHRAELLLEHGAA